MTTKLSDNNFRDVYDNMVGESAWYVSDTNINGDFKISRGYRPETKHTVAINQPLPTGNLTEQKLPDQNVLNVTYQLISRMEKGYNKYGTTTERNDLNLMDWLQHLQEELLDAAVYVERLKQELKDESK